MPKQSLMAFVLGGVVAAGGLVLGLTAFPAPDGGPNWPLIAAAVVFGGLIEGVGVLGLLGRPPR